MTTYPTMNQPPYPPPPPPPPPRRSWVRRHKILTAGIAVLAVVVIAAIAGSGDDEPQARTTDRPATTVDEPAGLDEPPAVPEPTSPPTTEPTGPVAVGADQWFEWEDGLAAQVTSLERFTPDYDSTPTPDVLVTVTVRNGTSQVFDAIMATVNLYGGPNGVQEEGEYSYFGFEGSIPPGSTATAKWSFTVPEEHMGQLLVEFSPSWDHDPGFFRGAA